MHKARVCDCSYCHVVSSPSFLGAIRNRHPIFTSPLPTLITRLAPQSPSSMLRWIPKFAKSPRKRTDAGGVLRPLHDVCGDLRRCAIRTLSKVFGMMGAARPVLVAWSNGVWLLDVVNGTCVLTTEPWQTELCLEMDSKSLPGLQECGTLGEADMDCVGLFFLAEAVWVLLSSDSCWPSAEDNMYACVCVYIYIFV